ncbi:MAG: NAD-dependent epimerase [Flavobacteriaceae bacterium]|jgi:UDP-glucuronate 4-epimerase|nr:NAD-dependent epimerase [Flavobacteriaceae bacterium]
MKILITGTAGFIGYHLAEALAKRGDEITGLDNINDYYDVDLKYGRLHASGFAKQDIEYNRLIRSSKYPNFSFIKLNLEDKENLEKLFEQEKFDQVINLAAQAGVRYSLVNPQAYIDSNIVGFLNILECCRNYAIKHLTYASSSSVYGLNEKQPFSTKDNIDHPVSLYAASKKSNELMAHTYSHLFGIPTTGLRFFTVYGPWGRPDMAFFIFTKSILENKPVKVYNYGKMQRDFTYISDIVEGVIRVNDNLPKGNKNWDAKQPDPSSSIAPYKVYNIGSSNPMELTDFIETIEEELGKKAEKNLLPIQPGDVPATYADITDLVENLGYRPQTSVKEGIKNFISWYRDFYNI